MSLKINYLDCKAPFGRYKLMLSL